MTKFRHFIGCAAIAIGAQYLAPAAALADDSTEKTGLLAALGIEAAGGETTVGDKGGQIEGYLLASKVLGLAARKVLDEVKKPAGNSPLILLAGAEKINFGLPVVLSDRIDSLAAEVKLGLAEFCQKKKSDKMKPSSLGAGTKPQLADIAGMVRTDTKITGFDIDLTDQAFVTAIGAARQEGDPRLLIPSDATAVSQDSEIYKKWKGLSGEAYALKACANDNESAKPILKRYDEFYSYATASPKDGTATPLEQAMALASLRGLPNSSSKSNLLRVYLEKAGGSIITRSNIFFKLGAPGAVIVGGGFVAGYRLVNPEGGELLGGGSFTCVLPETKYRSVGKTLELGTEDLRKIARCSFSAGTSESHS